MYYYFSSIFIKKACRSLSAIIPFILCFFSAFPAATFAATRSGQPAEEYRILGYEAQQEGAFEESLTFYSKAAALGATDAWLHNNVGVIYEQMHSPEKAETEYLRALKIDPDYLPAYTNLAFLYKERGDIPRAIRYFRTRIERALPNDEWAELIARELNAIDPAYRKAMVNEQLEEAGRRLYQLEKEELSLDVARADGLYRRAQQLVKEEKFDEAVTYIDRALKLTPSNPKLKAARTQILTKQKIFYVKKRVDKSMELLDSGEVDSAWQEIETLFPVLPGESGQK